MTETLTLMLAGDLMTGRGIDQLLASPSAPILYEPLVRDARDYVRLAERASGAIARPVDPATLWGDALEVMRRIAPRFRIVNLETAVTTAATPWPAKGIHYRMHPANVGCLTAGGVDCCVLANNHVLDWGRAGLAETLQTLQAAGLRTAGAGADAEAAWAPAALPLDNAGRRLLIFACATPSSGVDPDWAAARARSGVALLRELSDAGAEQLAAAVARQRQAGDRVLVSIHWGDNWVRAVPSEHRRFAHRLIDLGAADIVHGHSSHHPLPVEVYRDRLILYGCGDLLNDYEGIRAHGDLRSDLGCLYFATVDAAQGSFVRLEVVPHRIHRFRLEAADAQARAATERLLGGPLVREAAPAPR
jgi:poly-gamma-glutamate capsule biosynthesis protein CapA/YwtB (metallophosphatase superfamily)